MKGHTYSKRKKSADYPSVIVNTIMNLMHPRINQKTGKVDAEEPLGRKINGVLPRGERKRGKMRAIGWIS